MSRSSRLVSVAVATLVVAAALPSSASAQSWKERLKQKAKETVTKATEEKPAAEPAEETAGAAPAKAKSGASADSTLRPGEGAWNNYDFVPGERVLFAEDFTKDRVGDFPRRLEMHEGNMEVVEWNGRRWLRSTGHGAFSVPLPEALPQRFTVEFDLTLPWGGLTIYSEEYSQGGISRSNSASGVVHLSGTESGVHRANGAGRSVVDPRGHIPTLNDDYEDGMLSRPLRVRMQADGKYVKVYLNEVRISNMPNADFGRQKFLVFEFASNSNGGDPYPPLITNISINAGGRDMYDALAADGRVATQGILFDTGSDRIRPESTPTLKEIVAMLQEHADLKLVIEGHTDDVGNAAANKTLSEKRAAAVKAYLVQQGIDAARLESAGLGDTKPATPNTTPEGRQQNRRVELVKQG